MSIEKSFETKVKCPKCKSVDLYLIEVWKGHTIEFNQEGKMLDRNGNVNPGDPYKVDGHCKKCNHRWTIRNAIQISDIYK